MYIYIYTYIYICNILHIYYAHLVFVRFEHSVCRGSLMTWDLLRRQDMKMNVFDKVNALV